MTKNNANVLWFKQIGIEDVNLVGGKGGNLGEMYNLGIPIPNGFVVGIYSQFYFLLLITQFSYAE